MRSSAGTPAPHDEASAIRHVLAVGFIWFALTVTGLALVAGLPLLPLAASEEARTSDNAFLVLLLVSVPVFVLVEVLVVYSAVRFRAGGEGDGPPLRGSALVSGGWVVVTSLMVFGLAAFGWSGMEEMRGHAASDLTVRVTAVQFGFTFEYAGRDVASRELRLPVGRRVRFELTSKDVLHAFAVPAFRIKQDIVPGRWVTVHVTPTEVGRYGLQCAELCGVGHTVMRVPVEVMAPAAFDAWIGSQPKAAGR